MTRNIIKITYPLVLIVIIIWSRLIYSQRWGLSLWDLLTPNWNEAATVSILAIAVIPVIYGLSVLNTLLGKPNRSRTIILHSVACSFAATAITTVACAADISSLHCYTEYIFITKSCLPYYWVMPIFVCFVYVYYLADLSELKFNGKLTSAYTSWFLFLVFSPFLALFYEVFKLNVLGWQVMPFDGDTLFEATVKSYSSTLVSAMFKSVFLSPFYMLFIPFMKRFERT